MAKLRIVVVDDHAIVREGLKALINAQSDMDVIGEANDGQKAIEQVQALRPDVVVMDISMPDVSGVAATEAIRRIGGVSRVLALSVHEEPSYMRMLLEAGATGYVIKRSAADTLIQAIRSVAGGQIYLDPAVTGTLVADLLHVAASPVEPLANDLSEREAKVVRLIAQGYSNREIANQLGVSVKTVETYKSRAMEKLGVASRTELVRYAVLQGWLRDI